MTERQILKKIDKSPSHPVGSEQDVKVMYAYATDIKSPSHPVGLEQVLPCFGCLPPFSFVAIPHSGLGTLGGPEGYQTVKSVSIPHGGLRTITLSKEVELYLMSPSHAVGLELQKAVR